IPLHANRGAITAKISNSRKILYQVLNRLLTIIYNDQFAIGVVLLNIMLQCQRHKTPAVVYRHNPRNQCQVSGRQSLVAKQGSDMLDRMGSPEYTPGIFKARVSLVNCCNAQTGISQITYLMGSKIPNEAGILADLNIWEFILAPNTCAVGQRVSSHPFCSRARINIFPRPVFGGIVIIDTAAAGNLNVSSGKRIHL